MRSDIAFSLALSLQRLCVAIGITVRPSNTVEWHGSKLHQRVIFLLFPNEPNALGDGWQAKHGITFVMWIVTTSGEKIAFFLNNVRGPASWILIFLDILKIIGNS